MQFQCNTYGSRGLRCVFTESDRSLIHDSLQAWPGYGSVDSYFLGRLVPRLLTPNKLHSNKPPGPALVRDRIYDQVYMTHFHTQVCKLVLQYSLFCE